MIELKSLSLSYPLTGHYSHSLQSHLANAIGGVITGKSRSLVTYVNALTDVSLSINDGVKLGVVGHNGAGKTTLLRVISGVYPPSKGEVFTTGSISALTDFTLGMDPNADGVKNIIFRLVFMGRSFAEARRAVDEIIEFSGLGEYINLPIRTYSTGMYLRLAFSISTHFIPDILILDEVVGAGDEAFRVKALGRLEALIENSRIVVISSHDLGAVKKYCNRAVWMEKGRLRLDGEVNSVVDEYLGSVHSSS